MMEWQDKEVSVFALAHCIAALNKKVHSFSAGLARTTQAFRFSGR
jgi:hypothetical protein